MAGTVKYAVDQGAEEVLGIDVSVRMIEEAEKRNADSRITYRTGSLEEYEYRKRHGTV